MNGFINEKNPTFSTIISNQRNSRVALISFGGAVYQHSTRPIAAYLRSKGYKVSIIQCVSCNDNDERYFDLLTNEQLEELAGHCKGMLAVGISVLTTHYLNRAIQVNDYLKKSIKVPIVWGVRVFNMNIDLYDWLARVGCRFSTLMFAAIDLIIINSYVGCEFRRHTIK